MVVEIGHGERDFGFVAAGQGVVLADADHVISGLSDERHVGANVLDGGAMQLPIGDETPDAEEPGVVRRVAQLLVEPTQAADVG